MSSSWLLRTFRLLVALVFAASTLLYVALWMYAVRLTTDVELGVDDSFVASERALVVTVVKKDSPAEKAGMLPGDRITAIDGDEIRNNFSSYNTYRRHKPGDRIRLNVRRPGQAAPVVLTAAFRQRTSGATDNLATEVRNSYPLPFVLVGLTVLFLRLGDPMVWLLALLFASFAASPGFPDEFAGVPAALRPFAIVWKGFFLGNLGALFYFFFAMFPTRSALDRRWPWLKWAGLALGVLAAIDIQPEPPLARFVGSTADAQIILGCILPFITLGMIALIHNYRHSATPDARRRIRVFFWGTAVGIGPSLVEAEAVGFGGFHSPNWLSATLNAVQFLFPLSFAYAVVKHQVLEIPVLLRRSARYLLVQRGFLVLLSLGSIGLTLLFALSFSRFLQPVVEVAGTSGIALGAVFGTVLLWGGSQVHKRVSGTIDRAFFRAAYDARVILEDLAEKTRTATDSGELARTLEHHLKEALQPSSLVIYLQGGDGRLNVASGDVPPELAALPAGTPLVERESYGLASLHPDYVTPMLGRGGRLVGLLALGPRLSEESYSGEDQRLLASVASQAGTALENIRLAQEIAERMERDRRVAREMEIAREVQTRLLPQAPPHLKTIECAARCIQARSVGGDYYDFLDLGADRVGLVLADVSGKGVHAALLVANLQACLRSQSAMAPRDPVQVLREVNQMLWKSTAAQHYATLFFGIYDDGTRQLDYVNCGHNPPLWLRQDGTVERLGATATVIGLFEKWDCALGQVQMVPGDLLAVYSDGVTEETCNDEDFGEGRLIGELQGRREQALDEMIAGVFGSVQKFSQGAQSDDLTLLLARPFVGQPSGCPLEFGATVWRY